jgi:hypothetical protein
MVDLLEVLILEDGTELGVPRPLRTGDATREARLTRRALRNEEHARVASSLTDQARSVLYGGLVDTMLGLNLAELFKLASE